jgi:hypothetical protein
MITFKDFPAPPYEEKVSAKYGAPMGRGSTTPVESLVLLRQVPLGDGGDYDPGGAYWGGGGTPIFCAWDTEGNVMWFRANDFAAAVSKLPAGVTVFSDEASLRTTIRDGAASIFWGDAWAMHAENHACANLSGAEITAIMPEIPTEAVAAADAMIAGYEKANGVSIAELWNRALKADGNEVSDPEHFGGDLAWMAMSAGVSWFDDHEEFPLQAYRCENCDLQFLADEKCEEKTDRVPCLECGCYVAPKDDTVCSNCSAPIKIACERCKTVVAETESWGDGDVGDADFPSFCSEACYQTHTREADDAAANPIPVDPGRTAGH